MSLKGKIRDVGKWLSKLFKKADDLKDKLLPIAVHFVQAVKKSIESGTFATIADIAKTLIPGGADDVIIDRVVKYSVKHIPRLCIQLEILNAVNISDGDEKSLTEAINSLQGVYGDKWEEFTSGLAGDILGMLSDNKIDAKEAKELAKKFYDEYVK